MTRQTDTMTVIFSVKNVSLFVESVHLLHKIHLSQAFFSEEDSDKLYGINNSDFDMGIVRNLNFFKFEIISKFHQNWVMSIHRDLIQNSSSSTLKLKKNQ